MGFFKNLFKNRSSEADAHFAQGMAWHKQGRIDDAIREFQAALRINPKLLEAHHNLGAIYQRRGRLDDATREYLEVLHGNSRDAEVKYRLGVIYQQQGRIDDAIAELKTAAQLGWEAAGKLLNELQRQREQGSTKHQPISPKERSDISQLEMLRASPGVFVEGDDPASAKVYGSGRTSEMIEEIQTLARDQILSVADRQFTSSLRMAGASRGEELARYRTFVTNLDEVTHISSAAASELATTPYHRMIEIMPEDNWKPPADGKYEFVPDKGINLGTTISGPLYQREMNWDGARNIQVKKIQRGGKIFLDIEGEGVVNLQKWPSQDWTTRSATATGTLYGLEKQGYEMISPFGASGRRNAYMILSSYASEHGGGKGLRQAMLDMVGAKGNEEYTKELMKAAGVQTTAELKGQLKKEAGWLDGNEGVLWGKSKLLDSALMYTSADIGKKNYKVETMAVKMTALDYKRLAGSIGLKGKEGIGVERVADYDSKWSENPNEIRTVNVSLGGISMNLGHMLIIASNAAMPSSLKVSPQTVNEKVTVKSLVDEGVQKKRQGDYASAKQLYYRAIQIDPTQRMSFWSLAKVCYLMREQEEAITNYVRSAHLAILGITRAVATEPATKRAIEQQLLQIPKETLDELRKAHPSAPFLLFDVDGPCHLAHALVDFDNTVVKSDEILEYIATYKQVLAGEGGSLNDAVEDELYRPIGLAFLRNNLAWAKIDDPNVLTHYPDVAHQQQIHGNGVPRQGQATVSSNTKDDATLGQIVPSQVPAEQQGTKELAKNYGPAVPSAASSEQQHSTVRIRGKEYPLFTSCIVMEGEPVQIGATLNHAVFQCRMIHSSSSDSDQQQCRAMLGIVMEFVPSAWLCPVCGGLMILDSLFESDKYKRPNFVMELTGELGVFCYFGERMRGAKRAKLLGWLDKRINGQSVLPAALWDDDMEQVLTETIGEGRVSLLPMFVPLDDLKRYETATLAQHSLLAEAHLSQGIEYFQRGRVQDAIHELQESLRTNPDSAQAHYHLGVAYQAQNQMNDAIQEFKAVLHINPNMAEAHHNLGDIYGPQGRIDEAIHEFQEALRIIPNDPEVHANLGMAYGEQGRVDDEIREYLTAIRLNPNFAMPHFNLGVTYVQQGKVNDGISELRIADRLGYPRAHQVLTQLGSLGVVARGG